MFGTSVRVLQDSSRLIVTDPINYWSVLFGAVFTLYPLWLFLTPKYRSKRKGLLCFSVLLLWACFSSVTRLTLDRTTSTANLEKFAFLHWSRQSMPLSRIDHALVRTGSTTSQLALQYTDGSLDLFSGPNQTGGKDQAAHAINAFLGR
jgi:hypothetical protein